MDIADDLRKALLGPFADAGAASTPVAATFYSVLSRFRDLGLFSSLDEESVTAALLGGIASTFPFSVAFLTNDEAKASRCSWGQYTKSETSAGIDSEAVRGADFALVIWTSEEQGNVALFQAKKTASSISGISSGSRNMLMASRCAMSAKDAPASSFPSDHSR